MASSRLKPGAWMKGSGDSPADVSVLIQQLGGTADISADAIEWTRVSCDQALHLLTGVTAGFPNAEWWLRVRLAGAQRRCDGVEAVRRRHGRGLAR
mmetsp:Transcript_42173/g.97847  ORF Transcript_42173/g.97847 Transcript_42173/m.97847 type:complete len:96 (-) Transcript_42173:11-298(-)